MSLVGQVSCMERKGAYRVLVGKPNGKRLLGRPRLKYNCNNKMEF
jgi:hypothetical protein